MARQARVCLPHHCYHVILRGNNRQAIFTTDFERREYLSLLLESSREHQVAVHSYVLMDNHVHLLITPSSAEGMSAMMQQVGRTYVRRFNDRHERSGTLFEGRYRSGLVQTERHLLICMAYIDLNPVRAGLCAQVGQYAWSSHSHYAGGLADKLVTPHAEFFRLGNTPFAREAAYHQLIDSGLSASQTAQITRSILKQHALGDAAFIQQMESRTLTFLQPRMAGRPAGSSKKP
jgi:putative transposase